MSTDEGMKFAFVCAATEESPYWDSMTEEAAGAIWDEWIARVKRDAAREALDGLARKARADWHPYLCGWVGAVDDYRDAHYPEETP